MAYDPTQNINLHRDLETFDDPIRKVGHDATSTFDNSESNPTEHASSEAQNSATAVEGEDEFNRAPEDAGDPNVIDAADSGADDADVNVPEFDEDERDEEEKEADERDLEGKTGNGPGGTRSA